MPKVPMDPERHTARPGQAHLLPSAQAQGKKKKPITNKQTKKWLRKLREQVLSETLGLAWRYGPAEGNCRDGGWFTGPQEGLSRGKPGELLLQKS